MGRRLPSTAAGHPMVAAGATASGHCIGGLLATWGKACAVTNTGAPGDFQGFGADFSELGPWAKATRRPDLGLGGRAEREGAIDKPHGGSCAKGANGNRGDCGDQNSGLA
jgi:hypothetical protein